jgi:hypothetical protein
MTIISAGGDDGETQVEFAIWSPPLIDGKILETFAGTYDRFLILGEANGSASAFTVVIKQNFKVPRLDLLAAVSAPMLRASKEAQSLVFSWSTYIAKKGVNEKLLVPVKVTVMSDKVLAATRVGQVVVVSGALGFGEDGLFINNATVTFVPASSEPDPVTPGATPKRKRMG